MLMTHVLCVGDSLEATAAEANRRIEELVSWGPANGISFNPAKKQVMHFSRKPLKSVLTVRHSDIKKKAEAAIQWLGI